jgi:hypothetical protein
MTKRTIIYAFVEDDFFEAQRTLNGWVAKDHYSAHHPFFVSDTDGVIVVKEMDYTLLYDGLEGETEPWKK